MKKITFIIIIIVLIHTLVWASNSQRVLGKVLKIEKIQDVVEQETLKIEILEGKHKGKVINVTRERMEYSSFDFDLNIGDQVLMELYEDENGSLNGRFVNVWRVDKLKNLSFIFIISIILFGGLKGVLSISSLLFSAYVIVKFMVPGILKGYNIITISIFSALIIIMVSFVLIAGFTKKSLVSMLGTMGGTITAGLLAYTYSKLTSITGMADENVMFLITNMGIKLDFSSLYMCSILIGTIGATMDVSMSITTSMFEIKKQSPRIKTKDLLQSGFHIGKDIMSTMVNTLILAYAGSSMPLLIINIISDTEYIYSINSEILAMEIIRALCSSIGLVMTIPLTILIATHALK
ncbi:YibE/F family protein [Sporanaerobacter acetigenes]|uniref:Uncharacterized membrane protein n=1 Tax=Sporanaerobacter acetigenes DSM 13106 TaxID=1123281 RepID=A0A1M5X8M2_9FIRM|nr:YibE/F family protein [Sporanaerobacter acetigenes]SHH96149.1 Uncharacterized membrane protein [Sporanaerobacter acetigenes DSM 13106]